MDLIEMMERAAHHAADVVKGVGAGQLDKPTPCADWDVRELGNHMTGFLGFSAGAARGAEPQEGESPDFASGDDWASAYSSMADDMVAAWRALDNLDGEVHFGGGGMMKASDAASVTIHELVFHAWDLATATGQTYEADDDLAHLALQVASGGQSQSNDFYADPVAIHDEAPIFHRALAMSGRAPDWEHLGPLTQGHD